jgi:hypothetical protein
MLEAHPSWTPDQVKSTLRETARDISGPVDEVNATAAVLATPFSGANARIVPNDFVDGATGAIDYARSSWGRSSWGSAPDALVAGWARSSWGCSCLDSAATPVESTRSSWGQFAWTSGWSY